MVYYAKSPNEGGNQVTNQIHLREVSALARQFGGEIYMPSSAWIAGLLHDFGKYSQTFQDVLFHLYAQAAKMSEMPQDQPCD